MASLWFAPSSQLASTIPILGISRIEEVERFFEENVILEAESGTKAGLKKLKIYDRLVGR